MPKPPSKTNAARLLERARVRYELREYAVDSAHLGAAEVARQVGMDPRTVFKTLVAHGDRHGHCFAVVPATAELDLKLLARASDNRKVAMVALKEVQPLTGYIRGGVTALGARRNFPVFIDRSALDHDAIAVSAGLKGMQMVLAPGDYVRVTVATVAPLVQLSPGAAQ
ncbi:MAG: Cys-tRNA(Pro) deacylase [Myxococcales bacterium]|nr:Cys-tRNA(Pro) deacylase [Myxococcales bacterium]